ncbi:MAG: amidohydrolase family protein [Deltaproteobacteria bacterium]|nr:amidohydrolase family protein [Deltaproteobacteria bacterium]
MSQKPLKFDLHIHLAGTGCNNSGCWISPEFRRRWSYRLLKILHGISRSQEETTVDDDWVKLIAQLVAGSEIDYAVVLGFDAVIDPQSGAEVRNDSQLIVPFQWVFSVCEHNRGLLPGPSINPYRKDALIRLEACIKQGAVLIKWLPTVQVIDPADERLSDFYSIAARAKLPLLIHMGGEKTFRPIAPQYNRVELLKKPLEAGVPVICAHTATAPLGSSEPDQIEKIKDLLRGYPHFWVDNSGLCNPSRFFHLPRLAKDEIVVKRTLYGSDWPVPSHAIYYIKEMGARRAFQIDRLRNVSQKDIEIKRYFGYPDETLSRHAQVLANLDRWI